MPFFITLLKSVGYTFLFYFLLKNIVRKRTGGVQGWTVIFDKKIKKIIFTRKNIDTSTVMLSTIYLTLMNDKDLNSVFLFKLDNANKQFKKYKNRIFKKKGIDITGDQWILLKNIHEMEGINQTELRKRCKKEAAAVTRTLDILVRKGWVTREINPESRRVFNLFTTKDGKKMVKKILPIALQIRKQGSLDFSEKELKTLNRFLDRIYKNLE